MSVVIDVIRAVANTDAGTQTFTGDVGGLVPKAALFFSNYAVTNDVVATHWGLSFGAASSATEQWCLTANSESGGPSSDTQCTTDSDKVIRINQVGQAVVEGEADLDSFGVNSVTVDWTNPLSNAYLVVVVLIAGSDVQAYAGNKALLDVVNSVIDITDPGFEPQCVITACADSLAMDANQTHIEICTGMVSNEASVQQRCGCYRQSNGSSAGGPDGRLTATHGIMGINSNATLDWRGLFSAFDSNGFTVTTQDGAANDTALMYLALDFGDAVKTSVITHITPTAVGEDSETGHGFKPQFLYQIMNHLDALDTTFNSKQDAGSPGWAVAVADAQHSITAIEEDGAATLTSFSLNGDQLMRLRDDDDTAGIQADLVSFDPLGQTADYININATSPDNPPIFFQLAIEEEPSNFPVIPRVTRTSPQPIYRM